MMSRGVLYTTIIERVFPLLLCRDTPEKPPEKLLHAIWQNQRIKRAVLKTTKGEKVRILHPGFWNCESGPDFKNAVVQFGTKKPVQGDIEIDIKLADWWHHAHEKNPEYENVVLHVVWEITGKQARDLHPVPVLLLREFLEAPLAVLEDSVGVELGTDIPVDSEGLCARVFKKWDQEKIKKFLEHAALYRFEQKSIQLTARARDAGWNQALTEWLFRALGYKNNVWPFQCLGEVCPQIFPPENRVSEVIRAEALLLGVSGLLPDDLPRVDDENDSYIRKLWDYWWRERSILDDHILPRSIWRFHGIRPANHPQRRLALAARWISDKHFFDRIRHWFATDRKDFESEFLSILMPPNNTRWNWHYTINSKKLQSPMPLLGRERATDIAINVVLPWIFAIAREERNTECEERAVNYYLHWSASEDNALLKLAKKRFFGSDFQLKAESAALQQGIIQIAKNFCENSDSLCTDCLLPDEVSRYEFEKLFDDA